MRFLLALHCDFMWQQGCPTALLNGIEDIFSFRVWRGTGQGPDLVMEERRECMGKNSKPSHVAESNTQLMNIIYKYNTNNIT